MRRLGPLLVGLAAASSALRSAEASDAGSTTLAGLSRRAEAIAVVVPLGSPSPGVVRFRVAAAIRGPAPGDDLDVRVHPGVPDDFDPTGAGAWLLYLRRREEGAAFHVLGRGAVPIEGENDWAAVEAAADLAVVADLPDARLRDLLLLGLLSPSARVREDAAEELARLPRPLLLSVPAADLDAALDREEGQTSIRAALLRAIGARGDPGDLQALTREIAGGPTELFPLLAESLRAVPGGAEAAVRALDPLPPPGARRIEAVRLLARIGAAACAPPLARALSDPDETVRLAALEGPLDAEFLFFALASGTAPERLAAARSILLRGGESDRALLRLAADSFPGVRSYLDAVAADPFLLVQSKNR